MKYWTGTTTYPFDWYQVFTAFWTRYPNPNSQHVLTEDIISVKVKGQLLWIKKLISKRAKIPRIALRFTNGCQNGYVVEETFVDLGKKIFVTYTRNINNQNVLSIHEKCEYGVDKSNQFQVQCVKQAWTNSSVTGFGGVLCSIGIQQYQKNLKRQNAGFYYVLNSLYLPDFTSKKEREMDSKSESNSKVFYILHIIRQIQFKLREILIHLKLLSFFVQNRQISG